MTSSKSNPAHLVPMPKVVACPRCGKADCPGHPDVPVGYQSLDEIAAAFARRQRADLDAEVALANQRAERIKRATDDYAHAVQQTAGAKLMARLGMGVAVPSDIPDAAMALAILVDEIPEVAQLRGTQTANKVFQQAPVIQPAAEDPDPEPESPQETSYDDENSKAYVRIAQHCVSSPIAVVSSKLGEQRLAWMNRRIGNAEWYKISTDTQKHEVQIKTLCYRIHDKRVSGVVVVHDGLNAESDQRLFAVAKQWACPLVSVKSAGSGQLSRALIELDRLILAQEKP